MKYNINEKYDVLHDYTKQQTAIRKICNELNLVVCLPDYHADKNDKNTVIIYTKDGNEYNKTLSKWASVDDEKGRVCSFQNTDRNGQFDIKYMNNGTIHFVSISDTETILRNYINSALANYNDKQKTINNEVK